MQRHRASSGRLPLRTDGEAKDKVVQVTLSVPRAQLPTRAQVHAALIQQARQQRR
jgi:hypothetical protein